MKKNKIQKTLIELQKCSKSDSENVHALYDKLMEEIAKKYAPKIKKEADETIGNVYFWYA